MSFEWSIMRKVPRGFYSMETIIEAKALLRHYLVHRSEGVNRLGKIVEVEACLEKHGLASYSSKGLNAR